MKVKAKTPKLELATLLANKLVEGLISDEKNDDVRQAEAAEAVEAIFRPEILQG